MPVEDFSKGRIQSDVLPGRIRTAGAMTTMSDSSVMVEPAHGNAIDAPSERPSRQENGHSAAPAFRSAAPAPRYPDDAVPHTARLWPHRNGHGLAARPPPPRSHWHRRPAAENHGTGSSNQDLRRGHYRRPVGTQIGRPQALAFQPDTVNRDRFHESFRSAKAGIAGRDEACSHTAGSRQAASRKSSADRRRQRRALG